MSPVMPYNVDRNNRYIHADGRLVRDKFKWGDIPGHFISPRFLPDDVIWSANTKDGKTKNLKVCELDFKNRRKIDVNK